MEKLTVSTPYGEETLYQATLDAAVEHLAARLIPVAESFSALPITAELTEQLLRNMTEVLAGKENAGKLFHTVDFPDETGHLQSWKIDPVDQKMKDFIDAQLKISEASTSAITSGMGLHPSLSNVIVNGKLASGSELVYAFKLYLNTDTEIPYSIILEGINQAIAFNFPDKNVRLGFYHKSVKTEEQVSSSNRIKNE